MSFSETVAAAEQIIEGKVISVAGFKDARGRIGSRVAIEVAQRFKGDATGVYEIRIPVGVFEGRGVMVPGFPEFRLGENTIVFLTPASAAGMRVPAGYAQGKYRVSVDAASGRKLVQRESSEGLTMIEPSGKELPVQALNPMRDYDTFVTELRRIVQEQEAKKGERR